MGTRYTMMMVPPHPCNGVTEEMVTRFAEMNDEFLDSSNPQYWISMEDRKIGYWEDYLVSLQSLLQRGNFYGELVVNFIQTDAGGSLLLASVVTVSRVAILYADINCQDITQEW